MDPALDGAGRDPAGRGPAGHVTAGPGDPGSVPLAASTGTGPDASAPARSAAAARRRRRPCRACPAQLPPEVAGFAGRTAELRWLHALLPGPPPPGREPHGVPGRADHRHGRASARPRSRSGSPARPRRGSPTASSTSTCAGSTRPAPRCRPRMALQGFFDALGVPPRHVPAGLDAQSALLRTLLDGKRLLLLLDNAHDADQVRPLLPGSPGCLVLVTSRSQLTGLVVADGARPLPLGVLDGVEAAELLAGRLGAERVNAEPEAVAALVERTRRAAAGAERDLRAGGVPAGRGPGRPGGRARRRARPAGRAAHRRGGDRPARRVLLVGGQAQRRRGSGVPAAQRASGPGHLRPRGGQPARRARRRRRGPRWPSWSAPRC